MTKYQDNLAYRVFENDMKDRFLRLVCLYWSFINRPCFFSMKASLLELKNTEGYLAYFEGIRNTIAGCKLKGRGAF